MLDRDWPDYHQSAPESEELLIERLAKVIAIEEGHVDPCKMGENKRDNCIVGNALANCGP